MKHMYQIVVLGILFCSCCLLASAQANHLTINAVSFNYIAGTPDYTQSAGLVAGGSGTVATDGIANAALPQGAVVSGFTVCGRDDANDQNFVATLWRKTINPANSAFTPPQVMARVQTNVVNASNSMKCQKARTINNATIDNTQWTYFVELQIGFTVEVIAATIDY